MRNLLLSTVCAASLLGAAAIAADQGAMPGGQPSDQTTPGEVMPPSEPSNQQLPSETPDAQSQDQAEPYSQAENAFSGMDHESIIGAEVSDADGKAVGEIEDLVLSATGEVDGAVLATGGFLGIGEKKVLLDPENFTLEQGSGGFVLKDLTQEQIKDLPEFQASAADRLYSKEAEPAAPSETAPSESEGQIDDSGAAPTQQY